MVTALRRSRSSDSSDTRTSKRSHIKYNVLKNSPRIFKESIERHTDSCVPVSEQNGHGEVMALKEFNKVVAKTGVGPQLLN